VTGVYYYHCELINHMDGRKTVPDAMRCTSESEAEKQESTPAARPISAAVRDLLAAQMDIFALCLVAGG
jgi:hypothetical protein